MGSSARHSTGPVAVTPGARKRKLETGQTSPAASDSAVSTAMDELDEAICVVQSAAAAMEYQQAAEGRASPVSNVSADALRTVVVGGRLLRSAYARLDKALIAGGGPYAP